MKPKIQKSPESVVREIKRKIRREFKSEEKIHIILEGLTGEGNIAEIHPRGVIAPRGGLLIDYHTFEKCL